MYDQVSWWAHDESLWMEYRLGIDAIWTGQDLPTMEMSPETRLGLTPGWDEVQKEKEGDDAAGGAKKKRRRRGQESGSSKKLRRAYYRKSLQWHPDRWAGMAIYSLVVQGGSLVVPCGPLGPLVVAKQHTYIPFRDYRTTRPFRK